MIAIIDYGIGNLKSVHNAVSFISPQTKSIVTSDPDIVSKADKVIFPGQGAQFVGMGKDIYESNPKAKD